MHDDDLFLYELHHGGRRLDAYNSCPQYFEDAPIGAARIAEARHAPEAFAPILPLGVSVEELRELLDQGWWRAHDRGRLDEHGVSRDEDPFVFEGERMTRFGTLLGLHDGPGEYPYAAWGETPGIPWSEFSLFTYRRP